VAKRRGIPAVNIWGEVPFYLVEDDPRILKYTLWFLDRRFKLSLDLTALDMEIRSQNEKIAALRRQKPEVNKYISLVESNIRLSDEENEKLVREVTEFLRKKEQFS
jgi:proteasome assembly chaperone (PAC2) family protein